MFLKKELIQIPFSKVRSFDLVYDDEEDLKFGIINLCRVLNKGMFLIQVFLGDSINELLKEVSTNVINDNNFNYYLVEKIDFLEQLSFDKIRFLNIYTTIKRNINSNLQSTIHSSPINLGLDNYLDYTKIIIDLSKYHKKIINSFLR